MAKDASRCLFHQVEAENYTALWSFLSHARGVSFISINISQNIHILRNNVISIHRVGEVEVNETPQTFPLPPLFKDKFFRR